MAADAANVDVAVAVAVAVVSILCTLLIVLDLATAGAGIKVDLFLPSLLSLLPIALPALLLLIELDVFNLRASCC
jgi:hypothetical protein